MRDDMAMTKNVRRFLAAVRELNDRPWPLRGELGLLSGLRKAPMMTSAVQSLNEDPRPIFIDQADYLFKRPDMLDAMRDL